MRRCNNCRFENASDARACARCGQPLVGAADAPADGAPVLPDWMQSMQRGAAPEVTAVVDGSTSSAVAAAATLPVQVRRSRVPVLSVNGPAHAPGAALSLSPAETTAPPVANASRPVRRSNRLRSGVLLAIIVLALAYLVFRMYS